MADFGQYALFLLVFGILTFGTAFYLAGDEFPPISQGIELADNAFFRILNANDTSQNVTADDAADNLFIWTNTPGSMNFSFFPLNDTIHIDAIGAAGGEANTASNVGDLDIFKQKSGVDLEFRGLTAGDNIALTQYGNNVLINSTAVSSFPQMEQILNTTNTGCADGQVLAVNSSGIWDCSTTAGDNLGDHTATQHLDMDEFIIKDATYLMNGSSVLTLPQGGSQTILGNQSSIHDLVNVTATGCADGEFLTVSGTSWVCGTAGGGGGWNIIIKSADETVSSSTTLQDDDELTFSVDSSSVYVAMYSIFLSEGAGGIKHAITCPTGTSGYFSNGVWRDDSGIPIDACGATSNYGSGSEEFNPKLAIIETGGTAGSVTYQFAQQGSNGDPAIIHLGSWVMYKKLN